MGEYAMVVASACPFITESAWSHVIEAPDLVSLSLSR